MDGTKIHIAVNSLLECSVCLQVFQDPRNLPCGHTFCLQCIQNTNNRLCSLCKGEWSLPTNGWQGLPKNFIVENCITSLPSISYCAVAGDSSHGAVKFLCIDCWDPLCDKCGQGHTQFSKAMKNHVVKILNEIDISDIELHNRQKALICDQHKDKTIEFFCTTCEKFSCNNCYVFYHNKHACISVEEADAKLCSQLDELAKNVQESINVNEEIIEGVNLYKDVLENDKNNFLETIKNFIYNFKGKLQIEFEKMVQKVDEYYTSLIKLIVEKTEEKKNELEKNLNEAQKKLQDLREIVSSFEKESSSLSTPVERASFLKNCSFKPTQAISKFEVNLHLDNQLLDISKWKNDMDSWIQSLTKLLHTVKDLPQITENTKNVLIKSRKRFVYFYKMIIS